MNIRPVLHLISFIIFFVTLGMLASWGVSIGYGDPLPTRQGLLYAWVISLVIGLVLWASTRGPIDLTRRDGFGIVTLGWLITAHISALPYLMSGAIAHPISAVFESMSGYTATGSTVVVDIEALPFGILFWRSLTQWYGGMGIIVLCVAILPFLGVGGMQLYRAEFSGPSKDRLTPRIENTAKLLWGVYLLLTVLAALALRWAGMTWFDAVCHSFTTVATGGFSTKNASIAGYDSLLIEGVIVVFMILGALHFPLHYRALAGRPLIYFRDPEFRFFMGAIGVGILLVTVNVYHSVYDTIGASIRAGVFQVTTVISTSGFVSADYDQWPALSRFILLLFMIMGGCAGSTAGGLKAVRIFVLLKRALREVRLFMMPQAMVQIKMGRRSLDRDIVSNITSLFVIFMLIWALGTFAMTWFTPDLESAFSSVITTLGNVGPGFGTVGAVKNFSHIPAGGKIVLTLLMLLGRLEYYTVLVLFLPGFWRR